MSIKFSCMIHSKNIVGFISKQHNVLNFSNIAMTSHAGINPLAAIIFMLNATNTAKVTQILH